MTIDQCPFSYGLINANGDQSDTVSNNTDSTIYMTSYEQRLEPIKPFLSSIYISAFVYVIRANNGIP